MNPRPLLRPICYWFGCRPDYEALRHDCEAIPCERCGADDTTYADRVGDTRHERYLYAPLRRLRWHLFYRWLPKKCLGCGERFGCKADCDGVPF